MFRKRRISIVESYVKIVGYLGSNKSNERLSALKLLVQEILHSKSIKMPLNTARVQMILMKEAIKHRDNKRLQLERLRDFSISSFGQPRVIRRYLKEFNSIEVPETGQPLKCLNMGWDFHVHDNFSYGRKTPTQLIIDAFIKGISRITIVYNTLDHIEIITEAIEAGHIMGIDVTIGLEFSVGETQSKFHYIFTLPFFQNPRQCIDYLCEHKDTFDNFLKGIHRNQEYRIEALENIIQEFNTTQLPKINEGYDEDSIYYLPKLKFSDLDALIPSRHATRIHLGELLYSKYRPILFNRVLYLKSQQKMSDFQNKSDWLSEWECRIIQKRYEETRQEYQELHPENLLSKYFPQYAAFEPPTVFKTLSDAFGLSGQNLHSGTPAEGKAFPYRDNIKAIHSLEHGIENAIRNIIDNYKFIGHAEIYNMYDTISVEHHDLELFARFIHLLNSGQPAEVQSFLRDYRIEVSNNRLATCVTYCGQHPILPSCGSDSTGRTSFIPGMGFIYFKNIPEWQRADYLKNHYTLPGFASRIIDLYRKKPGQTKGDETEGFSRDYEIINMGKSRTLPLNPVGDEQTIAPIPFRHIWRYIHPVLKVFIYIAIGFIPAYLTIGLKFTLVWMGITAIRNIITDVVSGRGYRPKEWHVKNIDFLYLSHSLFWTGFSVPLLQFVKSEFDLLYALPREGIFYEFLKFFVICTVNGSYLMTHNIIRGFDRATYRANLFRAFIAWPFATLFSFAGNFFLIPSIVQAKFWSDFVAGIIEGTSKFKRHIGLGERDLNEILPQIKCKSPELQYIAILDLLYWFHHHPRTRNSLKYILFRVSNPGQKLLKWIIHGKKRELSGGDPSNYGCLKNWFAETNHFYQLIDFIISNYKPQYAIILTDLVSDTYNDFYKWLLRCQRSKP